MSGRIEPGVMCIVTRSFSGNGGAIVEVIRWVPAYQSVPECSLRLGYSVSHMWHGWLCKAERPLKNPEFDCLDNELYGVFGPEQLTPITPPSSER